MDAIKTTNDIESYSLSEKEIEQFQIEGYLGPFPLLEKGESETVLKKVHSSFPNLLLPNILARHTVIKEMATLAVEPAIIQKVVSLLGKDVLLWGSQLIEQKGNKIHRFHRDAEYATIDGISVWVGLKNVVKGETFKVITGSHLFHTSPQSFKKDVGISITDDLAVEKAAKEINPESRLKKLEVGDGEFIIFSGKLWHATKNITDKTRFSLNFRYTSPLNKVIISKNGELTSTSWEKIRPLCIVAAGEDKSGINKHLSLGKISRTRSFVKGVFFYCPNNMKRRVLNKLQILRSKFKI